jgi:hypothetical protein
MEQGWDPEIKKYFRKIISSISLGLLWLMSGLTLGLYYGLAYRNDISMIYVILFYAYFLASLLVLIRYLHRTWRK